MPDWPWEVSEISNDSLQLLNLVTPLGRIELAIETPMRNSIVDNTNILTLQIYRKGKAVYGHNQENPIYGWVSPTYGYKHPALSIRASTISTIPARLVSKWNLPA